MKRLVVLGVGLVAIAVVAVAFVSFSGGSKAASKLHGRIAFAVLAPTERTDPIGQHGRDLVDGANMAAAEINGRGGVLGRRPVLTAVDDACSVPIAYEAAKEIAEGSGITGVVAPATGGALAKALHELGYKGTFAATAATSSAENTPTAAKWLQRFEAAYHHAPGVDALQAYDAARTLAQATRQAGSRNTARIAANLNTINDNLTTFLGVVRFASDHTLLYDDRVILVVKNGRFTWKRSLRTDSLQ